MLKLLKKLFGRSPSEFDRHLFNELCMREAESIDAVTKWWKVCEILGIPRDASEEILSRSISELKKTDA